MKAGSRTVRKAAIGNANLLVSGDRDLAATIALGCAAIAFALVELADAVREHK